MFGQRIWDIFTIYRLNTIMRQQEDVSFSIALNHMGLGTMTTEDIQLLRTRVFNTVPEEVADMNLEYRYMEY